MAGKIINIRDALRKHCGAILLSLAAFYLITEPFAHTVYILQDLISPLSMTALILVPITLLLKREHMIASLTVLASYCLLRLTKLDNQAFLTIKTFLSVIMDFLIIGFFILRIIGAEKITRDYMFASMFVYLLIGFLFADMYFLLQRLQLASFMVQYACPENSAALYFTLKNPAPAQAFLSFQDALYFSFATLTTAGYGDIAPLTPLAKRLASIESCCGTFYMSLFIGRLVGLRFSMDKDKQASSACK